MALQQDPVAILDDDPSVLKALTRLLSSHGYRTLAFSSVPDFLNATATIKVACLVSDIQLGGDSGLALGRRLAAMDANIPIIFMTGSNDEILLDQTVELGCVACLRKPFTADQLIGSIQ